MSEVSRVSFCPFAFSTGAFGQLAYCGSAGMDARRWGIETGIELCEGFLNFPIC